MATVTTTHTTAPPRRAWGMLALLTFVYVINFLDRQLLSILAKPIQDTLHISDGQLGLIGGRFEMDDVVVRDYFERVPCHETSS